MTAASSLPHAGTTRICACRRKKPSRPAKLSFSLNGFAAERRILAREATTRDDGAGGAVRVKTATRPDGTRTAKAEMDDVAAAGDHAARMRLRRRVEDA